jgi:tetratricopeptide (TPR) repeat protein
MILRAFTILTLIAGLGTAAAHGQTRDAGLAAEGEGRWDDAVRIHRAAIEADPSRVDLWVRIADIEARRGNLNECITALQKAATAAPGNASIYFRLSQAYSTAGQPTAALNAIEGALALNPNSVEYLRARATLATWNADYSRAQDSYRQLATLEPEDVDLALAYARVSAWAGDTNEAVAQYQRYLKKHPDVADAWIELAKAESWRGNSVEAVHALSSYRSRFGETPAYSGTLAAVMAAGGRPTQAEEVVTPLLQEAPDSLELNLTRTIALAMQRRTREAFSSLDTVRRIAPDSRDTRSAERVVRTMLGSTAGPAFSFYSDSDNLQLQRFTPNATVALVTGTQFSAGFDRTQLDARSGSGLDQIDGTPSADYRHSWVGVAQKVGRFTFDGQGGYATSGTHSFGTYTVGATARPVDNLMFSVQRSSGAVVISPRTVGLGLTQIGHRLQVEWAPTLQSTIAFDGSIQDFSDGNRRIELIVAPRRSFARTAGFNLDLGVSAYRLETEFDLADGYYDPRRYEHYAFTAFPYFKISENIGLSLSTAAGVQRDSYSPSFHFGGSANAEATFGIYQPWALKINGSASMNRRLESGAFRGLSCSVALVRRF